MARHRPEHGRSTPARLYLLVATLFVALLASAAVAQDIRGLEVCTAEKQLERRTACLQANIEFLQQTLTRMARETQDKIAATARDLATARTEVTTLKSTVEKLTSELSQMKADAERRGKK
jgi:chromosome segregation ATPase